MISWMQLPLSMSIYLILMKMHFITTGKYLPALKQKILRLIENYPKD